MIKKEEVIERRWRENKSNVGLKRKTKELSTRKKKGIKEGQSLAEHYTHTMNQIMMAAATAIPINKNIPPMIPPAIVPVAIPFFLLSGGMHICMHTEGACIQMCYTSLFPLCCN